MRIHTFLCEVQIDLTWNPVQKLDEYVLPQCPDFSLVPCFHLDFQPLIKNDMYTKIVKIGFAIHCDKKNGETLTCVGIPLP